MNKKTLPKALDKQRMLMLYEQLLLLRNFELKVEELFKAGKMPGFAHLYMGEEAVAVGVCANLQKEDWITSTHRGHGHALAKGMSPKVLLAELMGKASGCCGGRGGTMHLFDSSIGLFGTNGIVAGGIPLGAGVAFSAKTRNTDQVAVTFFGDGATNHGAFHESINFAAIQNLPVIFVCENNFFATTTAISKTTKNTDIASKAVAYGIPGIQVDGNDVIAVWQAAKDAVERARKGGGATLIEALTYRWDGHYIGEEKYGVYRTKEELDAWKERCPIKQMRQLLEVELQLCSSSELDGIEKRIEEEIVSAVDFAKSEPMPELATAYDHILIEPINPPEPVSGSKTQEPTEEKRWLDAVIDGIAEEMRRDQNILYFGEGTAERGGAFGQSKGLWQEFGDRQNIDTPISELGFTGVAIAASATGCRSIVDLMFVDLLFEAASQIIHQAAKLGYVSNRQFSAPVVIRGPMGCLKQSGAHHSGSYYPMWAHCPGLIIAIPSNPSDAKGLMKTALRTPNPVIFLEHKALFNLRGQVPKEEHLVPFGEAKVVMSGTDLTIVSCGLLLHHCLKVAQKLQEQSISCEVIDLCTIVPLDIHTITKSIKKTCRLLVVDEAYSMCGLGGEIAAAMMENAFDYLDAPVGRIHTPPVAYPFSPVFDDCVLVTEDKIADAVKKVLAGIAPKQWLPQNNCLGQK